MARIDIADFDVTDWAVTKLWSHGIGIDQLYAVLDNFWIVAPNRKGRAASHSCLARTTRVAVLRFRSLRLMIG